MLKWRLGRRAAAELDGALDTPARPVEVSADALSGPPGLQVTWLGHATHLVQLDGRNLLTDPVFGHVGPGGLVRRLAPAPLPAEALPPIDAILLSHNHYDHADVPSLRAVRGRNPDALLLVPAGLDDWARSRVGGPVQALGWWSHASVGPVRVHAVPAQHWSTRGPGDICRSHWCGFVAEGRSGSVYFAGDTGFGPHFEAIATRHRRIDVGLLPIGAYAPRWFMRDQHMGPQESVEAARILSTRLLGMHWGTFRLTDEPLDEPPRLALQSAAAAGVDLTLVHPGGRWTPAATHGAWSWG